MEQFYGCVKNSTEPIYISTTTENNLGFNKMGVIQGTVFFQEIEPNQESSALRQFAPYGMGLSKLIHLVLGLDEKNNPITKTSNEQRYNVCEELKSMVNEEMDNPWNKKYINLDNFLPYHIAKMFKQDAELYARAQSVVDLSINRSWYYYRDLITQITNGSVFKDREGSKPYQLNEVEQYMLGPEQSLAYTFLCNIRLLWYGTLNTAAFYKFTLPSAKFLDRLPDIVAKRIPFSFAAFKKDAYEKKVIKTNTIQESFIDVWHDIVTRLKNSSNRQHWISFDGHGWVVSFDQHLIDLQKDAINRLPESGKAKQAKINLLESLECIGIESSHSKDLNSFYKRERKK